jgi:predicted nucleic acid-binding protein
VGVALLDSSALIGYLDVDDALHAAAVQVVEELLRNGSSLAISAVSWAELLNGAHQGHHDEHTVRGFVEALGMSIMPVDAAVAERAASLQARHAATGTKRGRPRLRTPDALILATAAVADEIDAVVCGDAKWTTVSGIGVQVRLLRTDTT